MDKIILKGMKFNACHGVLEQEKTVKQPFIIDLELVIDLGGATESDSLSDTIDYSAVYKLTEEILLENSFNLIEKIAGVICGKVFDKFPQISEMLVRIKKPNAPVRGDFKYMGVEIVRKKHEI